VEEHLKKTLITFKQIIKFSFIALVFWKEVRATCWLLLLWNRIPKAQAKLMQNMQKRTCK